MVEVLNIATTFSREMKPHQFMRCDNRFLWNKKSKWVGKKTCVALAEKWKQAMATHHTLTNALDGIQSELKNDEFCPCLTPYNAFYLIHLTHSARIYVVDKYHIWINSAASSEKQNIENQLIEAYECRMNCWKCLESTQAQLCGCDLGNIRIYHRNFSWLFVLLLFAIPFNVANDFINTYNVRAVYVSFGWKFHCIVGINVIAIDVYTAHFTRCVCIRILCWCIIDDQDTAFQFHRKE